MANKPAITIIDKTDRLALYCERWAKMPFITVDTEFMRERTYFSQLCLIQVASENEAAIIDPLADGLDLAPFLDLLANKNVLKIFHAARQDIEIFYHLMKQVPAPLFDTQIAAMACGYGDQIGYEPLIRMTSGATIDKGSRFTDWARRPLSDKQLIYALGDVTHLIDAYKILLKSLQEKGREDWVREEMAFLLDPSLYFVKPEEAWRRLKLRSVRPKELGPLIKLAEWREREAQHRNVPRQRIIKDDAIFELARQAPTTPEAMARCRSISGGFERSSQAKGLLNAIEAGLKIPRDRLPKLNDDRDRTPVPADIMELLRVLLKHKCQAENVAPKLLASVADLEAIARYDEPDIPAMKGWRRKIFGEAALKLKRGELAMRLKDGEVDIFELNG